MALKDRFFSVLTELARQAKQPMPLEQWQKYLVPGKTLVRGGVRFPLRADEVKYGPLSLITQNPRDYDVPTAGAISPEEMVSVLEDVGTGRNMVRELPTYPVFHTLGENPNLSPRQQPRMHYPDQHQLPGEKLGQAEELTLLPGSDFVPSTHHFGGQPGLVSWSRTTRRPVSGTGYTANHKETFDRERDKLLAQGLDQDTANSQAAKMADEEYFNQKKTQETALHLEEIQSDWHQRAREEGYIDPNAPTRAEALQVVNRNNSLGMGTPQAGLEKFYLNRNEFAGMLPKEDFDLLDRYWSKQSGKIPPAPYKDTYPELELRKGVARAVENGDNYVTWTTGDQQADRWGQALRNSVDEIRWFKNDKGRYDIAPMKNGRDLGAGEQYANLDANQLEDLLGQDVAKKILAGDGKFNRLEPDSPEVTALTGTSADDPRAIELNMRDYLARQYPAGVGSISGDNLTVGGSGMRLFYDRKVPEAARKLAAQYGGEVTKVKLPGANTGQYFFQAGDHPSYFSSNESFYRAFDQASKALGDTERQPDHPLSRLEAAFNDYQYLKDDKSRPDLKDEAVSAYKEAVADVAKLLSPKDQEVWALKITPEMRKKVLEAGLPLFSAGAAGAAIGTGMYAPPAKAEGYAKGGLVKKALEPLLRYMSDDPYDLAQSFPLNSVLRKVRGDFSQLHPTLDSSEEMIRALDQLIRERGTVADEPFTVYRGLGGDYYKTSPYREHGYGSTTRSWGTAHEFADQAIEGNPTVYQFDLPAGTPYLDVVPLIPEDDFLTDMWKREQQILLPRGMTYHQIGRHRFRGEPPSDYAKGGIVRRLAKGVEDLAGAAWLDKSTGEIYGPYAMHVDAADDPEVPERVKNWLSAPRGSLGFSNLDEGFITHGGDYISRRNATRALQLPVELHGLDLEEYWLEQELNDLSDEGEGYAAGGPVEAQVEGFGKGGLVEKILGSSFFHTPSQTILGRAVVHESETAADEAVARGLVQNKEEFYQLLHDETVKAGYHTNKGRFLDRMQAGRLLTGSDPTDPDDMYGGWEANHEDLDDLLKLVVPKKYAAGGPVTAPAPTPTADYFTLPLHPWLKYFGLDKPHGARLEAAPVHLPEVNVPVPAPDAPAAPAPEGAKQNENVAPLTPSTLTGYALPDLAPPPAPDAASVPSAASDLPNKGGTTGAGASPAYLAALDAAETGDPAAPVAGSSALGYYRFTEGTWADLAKAHPELGLTPAGRTDRTQADRAALAFTADNAAALADVGAAPTDANLRVLHVLGRRGGPALLYALETAPGDAAAKHASRAAVAANPTLFYKKNGDLRSVRELYGILTKNFPGTSFADTYLSPAPAATS